MEAPESIPRHQLWLDARVDPTGQFATPEVASMAAMIISTFISSISLTQSFNSTTLI